MEGTEQKASEGWRLNRRLIVGPCQLGLGLLLLARRCWMSFLSPLLEPGEERGEHHQGQQRGGDEAARLLTDAGPLRYSPVNHGATMPPIIANGRLRIIRTLNVN